MTRLSVLIPAHNEAQHIQACLAAVFASSPLPDGVSAEVLVLANGCTDNTADLARAVAPPQGWQIRVLEQRQGGKLAALNAGDEAATGDILAYLDADVRLTPAVLPQLIAALDVDAPRYGSGTPQLAPARSLISAAYGRLWRQLPFVTTGVPGFGLFAMNRVGRARWHAWPEIIADDTFARLNFTPNERIRVAATYRWPLVEGFRNLVQVRRRQNQGVAQIAALYPQLLHNDDKPPPSPAHMLQLLARTPFGFVIYVIVALAVKSPLFRSQSAWARGR